jgi:superfamily II DNA or RNA helicase
VLDPRKTVTPPVELREKQQEALDAIIRCYNEGKRRLLLVLPTGFGKTAIASKLPDALKFGRFDVCLWLAHQEELLGQSADAFRSVGAWVEREKAKERASPMSRIIVGSMQTMKPKRITEFFDRFRGRVKVLIIDEAHRATSPTYRRMIDAFFRAFPDGLLLGLTATPKRTDNVGLNVIFEDVAYAVDLDEAIEDGYLVPIEAYSIRTNLDLSKVKMVGGDFDRQKLAEALDNEQRLRVILEAFTKIVKRRKSIIFAPSIAQCHKIAARLTAAGFPTRAVWGKMPDTDREGALEALASGAVQALVCQQLLVEGVDLPNVECVIMWTPTKSSIKYRQCIGRGMRPLKSVAKLLGKGTTPEQRRALIAASEKKACVVIDVVDADERPGLLTIPTLFGLPPKLNLKGRNPLLARREAEKAIALDPKAAALCEDMEALSQITQVDLFAVPSVPKEVASETQLAWYETLDGHYKLRLPLISYALTSEGERIDNFQSRLRDLAAANRRAGLSDPVGVAYQELDVKPADVVSSDVLMEVTEDTLGRYVVTHTVNGRHERLAVDQSRARAFAQAESFVRATYGAAASTVRRSAPWMREPVTARQVTMLKRLGVPLEKIPERKGDASALITALNDRKRR